jgi:hypothetical protein
MEDTKRLVDEALGRQQRRARAERDFMAAHRAGERRTVRQGRHLVTQVFGADGWRNVRVEEAPR